MTVNNLNYLENKQADTVTNAVMSRWVCYLGTPDTLVHENGGEFVGESMQELWALLNIRSCTTGTKAAFMNGVSERNHAFVDQMLKSLAKDYPQTD